MKPPLKWVGGKTQILEAIKAKIPSTWDPLKHNYVEPFFGGGALFFDLQPAHAYVNDVCFPLISFYNKLATELPTFLKILGNYVCWYETHANQRKAYEAIRAEFNAEETYNLTTRAVQFYCINKLGFNGLYRENAQGKCNTPWGKHKKLSFNPEQLTLQSKTLQNVFLRVADFIAVKTHKKYLTASKEPALIYCDPPYLNTFTSYNAGGFTYADQLRLVLWATEQRDAGHCVIISQSNEPAIIGVYENLGWKVDLIDARRNVNSNGTGRGKIKECLIY